MSLSNTLRRIEALEAAQSATDGVPDDALTEVDADELDDELILHLACRGLRFGHSLSAYQNSMPSEQPPCKFRVTFSNPMLSPRYWQRIAERADELSTVRGLVLLPLDSDECRLALDYFADGTFWCAPLQPTWKPLHMYTICSAYYLGVASPEQRAINDLKSAVAHAFDQRMYQLGDHELITTMDKAIEVLQGALEYSLS